MMDSADSLRTQVRKILESRTFRDTEVLKHLLDYLAQQKLNCQDSDLKEYTVGVEAFGKAADYNPQSDSSVRVQAWKLRQKLEAYYRTEGTGDEYLVELPKGHFNLEFRQRPGTTADASKSQEADSPTMQRNFRREWTIGIVCLLLIVTAAALYVTSRNRSIPHTAWTAETQEFWDPFFQGNRPVMVVLGTPLFVKGGTSMFFRHVSVNSWDTTSTSEEVRAFERMTGAAPIAPSFNYTPIGEAKGAFELQRLLLAGGHELMVEASSELTWEDINRYNMIFLGPPKYIPQTLDLPISQDFEIKHHSVQNLHPAPGEPSVFDETWNADHSSLSDGYALISRLPGPNGSGKVLVLAGSSTECTRAAVEFVTHPENIASLVKEMHARGGIPNWFQIVLHARFKSKTPIEIKLVTMHALK